MSPKKVNLISTIKGVLLLLGLLVFSFPVYSQDSATTWRGFYGGEGLDEAKSVRQLPYGGYILAGWTFSNDQQITGNHGKQDVWVIKLSATGDILWQHCYGGSRDDEATDIKETYSGDFVVCGNTWSNDGDITENKGNSDYWVFLIDSAGNMIGQRTLGGSGKDMASSVTTTFDGGYAIAGTTLSLNGDVTVHYGQDDYWIVKLNAEGTIEWQHTYGGSKDDIATSLIQTLDGGYGIAGYIYSDDKDITENNGNCDYWILKLDSLGKMEWQTSLGDETWDVANCIEATSDWGFIVAGYTESRDKDFSTINDVGDNGISGDAAEVGCTLMMWLGALVYDLLKPQTVYRDIWVTKF